MNIGILLPPAEKNNGGINRVTYNTLYEMSRMDIPHNVYTLGQAYEGIDYPMINTFNAYMKLTKLNFTLSAYPMDIVHTYYNPIDFSDTIHCRRVMTIYDLYTIANPQWFSKTYVDFQNIEMRKGAEKSDIIIAISEATKSDIIYYYGIPEERIKVVYCGINPLFLQKKADAVTIDCPERYVLSVSAIAQNKNQTGLVKAFCRYKELHKDDDAKLVLVGAMRQPEEIAALLQNNTRYKDDIIYTGYVTDDELLQWYDHATLFAYPSFYEGFGMPIVEALVRGRAVVCSSTTSMPEAGGDAAQYCDPNEIDSIAAAIEKVLQDDELRKDMQTKSPGQALKFTPDNAARETLKIYGSLM
jgi:glycosyltransferase involved in cell wall biosynthesis